MLTNMQIAVIGGDARQLEIIRKLIEMDVKLSLIGFEQLDHAFSGATKEKIAEINFSQIDAIILPVAGTSLEGQVDSIFSNEKVVLLEEMLQNTPPHCVIFFWYNKCLSNWDYRWCKQKISSTVQTG